MRISIIKQQAKKALATNWGYAVLITVIVCLINMIPNWIDSMLGGGIDAALHNREPLSARIIGDLLAILLIPLSIGYNWYFLDLSRGRRGKWTTIFEPFDVSIYLKMLGASLLVSLFTFLWSLLFIIPGIIKGISYSQTMLILKDQPDLTINQAITKSRELMIGHKWRYFGFVLSFIGWLILSIITLGIGFLWLAPYFSTSCASFYNHLIHRTFFEEEEKDNSPFL